jgi:hypothetical protein
MQVVFLGAENISNILSTWTFSDKSEKAVEAENILYKLCSDAAISSILYKPSFLKCRIKQPSKIHLGVTDKQDCER